MKLFTYGTLKDPVQLKKDGATNIIENACVSGYKMYLFRNSFPVTYFTGMDNDVIYGTLFDIPLIVVLTHYDPIEGYNLNRSPKENMYNRRWVKVETPDRKEVDAQMYVANEEWFNRTYIPANLIKSGNFDDRLNLSFDYVAEKVNERRDAK